jgi:hypothetical protein
MVPAANLFLNTTDVQSGDPVDIALSWAKATGNVIPVICAANDKRAGGDWETGVQGYEERLCRRSTLASCLGTPAPGSTTPNNFPIPSAGGIYSSNVGKSLHPTLDFMSQCLSGLNETAGSRKRKQKG